jgi:hypothetical protein
MVNSSTDIDTHAKGKDPKVVCGKIIKALELEHEEHYQLGRTKVFLRKDAYEIIEGIRSAKLKAACMRIQALVSVCICEVLLVSLCISLYLYISISLYLHICISAYLYVVLTFAVKSIMHLI